MKKRIEFPLFEMTVIGILVFVLLIFALPKYMDVGREARIKTLNAVALNIDSVNRLMYSRATIKNLQHIPLQHSDVLAGDEVSINLVYGEIAAEQDDLINVGVSSLITFEKTQQSGEIRLYLKKHRNEGCYINYQQAHPIKASNTSITVIKKASYQLQTNDC